MLRCLVEKSLAFFLFVSAFLFFCSFFDIFLSFFFVFKHKIQDIGGGVNFFSFSLTSTLDLNGHQQLFPYQSCQY